MLTFDEIKTAQSAPGFNLAQAAQAATVGSPTYVPPNPAQPVSTNNLSSNLSVPPATTSNPTPFVGSIMDSQKYFQDLYNKQTADLEAARKEREDFKKILGDSYAQLDTMPSFYKQTEESLGIPKQYEDLNKINLQIADLSGAYDKEFARVETKGIQSGTPAIFYQGEQGAIQRQKAVEIGALSVRQAAMAGNLDLANQRAAKVTELQFQPIENKIKRTLDFINMNYQDMTAAEKRQADTLQNALAFQQAQLAEQKENVKEVLTAGVTTRYANRNGEFIDTSTGKIFPDPQSFFAAAGVKSFDEAYKKGLVTDVRNGDRMLSITEAKQLGVPFGTTEFEAKGIVPKYSGDKPDPKIPVNDAGVRNWLLKNKRENPDLPYFELWGILAEDMKEQGLNPSNYDAIFWEVLHPLGEAGYKAEQAKIKKEQKAEESGIKNPYK